MDEVLLVAFDISAEIQHHAFAAAGGKTDQLAPVAEPSELAGYDAVIFGTGTRFGNMSGQMRTFLDQTGSLWSSGALVGKEAAGKLILEETLIGHEVSLLLFADGKNYALMPPARDHKRIGELHTFADGDDVEHQINAKKDQHLPEVR